MMRKMAVTGLMFAFVFAVAGNSFAGATGKSYKIDVSDGTKAAVAFDVNGTDMLVPTPGADVKGKYTELPPNGAISIVIGRSFSQDYLGFFVATQVQLLKPSTLTGYGIGTTGFYTFKGLQK